MSPSKPIQPFEPPPDPPQVGRPPSASPTALLRRDRSPSPPTRGSREWRAPRVRLGGHTCARDQCSSRRNPSRMGTSSRSIRFGRPGLRRRRRGGQARGPPETPAPFRTPRETTDGCTRTGVDKPQAGRSPRMAARWRPDLGPRCVERLPGARDGRGRRRGDPRTLPVPTTPQARAGQGREGHRASDRRTGRP